MIHQYLLRIIVWYLFFFIEQKYPKLFNLVDGDLWDAYGTANQQYDVRAENPVFYETIVFIVFYETIVLIVLIGQAILIGNKSGIRALQG